MYLLLNTFSHEGVGSGQVTKTVSSVPCPGVCLAVTEQQNRRVSGCSDISWIYYSSLQDFVLQTLIEPEIITSLLISLNRLFFQEFVSLILCEHLEATATLQQRVRQLYCTPRKTQSQLISFKPMIYFIGSPLALCSHFASSDFWKQFKHFSFHAQYRYIPSHSFVLC